MSSPGYHASDDGDTHVNHTVGQHGRQKTELGAGNPKHSIHRQNIMKTSYYIIHTWISPI
jgi:hypothetical protein